jgi:hypothetical protein
MRLSRCELERHVWSSLISADIKCRVNINSCFVWAQYDEDFEHKYLDDMVVLRRLGECEKDSQSVLDCEKLVEKYKNIMEKVGYGF